MGGQVGRVGHAHMSYYARARVIPDHLVCPIDYPSMPLSISHSMPGFCWRDIGHKALCPISYIYWGFGRVWVRINGFIASAKGVRVWQFTVFKLDWSQNRTTLDQGIVRNMLPVFDA